MGKLTINRKQSRDSARRVIRAQSASHPRRALAESRVQPGFTAAPTSDDERRALAKVTAGLDILLAPKRLLQNAMDRAKEWRSQKRSSRKARHQMLEGVYEVYVRAQKNAGLRALIDRECDRKEMRRTAASNPAIVLVKLIIDPPAASVTQYALALRQAAMEGIKPKKLAQALAQKGNGIAAMATRFSKSHPKKKRSPQQRQRKNSIKGNHISWEWKPAAMRKWTSIKGRACLVVRKKDPSHVRVLSVRSVNSGTCPRPESGAAGKVIASKPEAIPSSGSEKDDDWE